MGGWMAGWMNGWMDGPAYANRDTCCVSYMVLGPYGWEYWKCVAVKNVQSRCFMFEDTVFSLRGPLSATSKQYPPWYPPDKSEEHRYKNYKIQNKDQTKNKNRKKLHGSKTSNASNQSLWFSCRVWIAQSLQGPSDFERQKSSKLRGLERGFRAACLVSDNSCVKLRIEIHRVPGWEGNVFVFGSQPIKTGSGPSGSVGGLRHLILLGPRPECEMQDML